MRVLIGCEESQVVCQAFRDKGHEAYSCDLIATRGNPDWHIQGDIMDNLAGWDLIILHPDCTAMSLSVNRWYGKGMPRHSERQLAINWTIELWEIATRYCTKVALENPKSVIWSHIQRAQYIQPYEFGHLETKATGLALWNLPCLVETDNVKEEMDKLPPKEKYKVWYASPGPNRKRDRSRTYQGIADAMAEQWG